MTKPKAVAQAVTAKKRMPSLLRSANNRIHKRSSSAPHRNVDVPPVSSFDADPKTLAQISDLTEPLYELKRDPPVHEVHSAYHSAASSLTQPSALEKARRSFSADIDHPKYSNLIYPESPKASKQIKPIDVKPALPLNGPTLHALDKLAIQKSDSSDTLSQQYVIKKRSLVVGIPIDNVDSGLQKHPSPKTDIAVADSTAKHAIARSPTTEDSVVFAGSKLGGTKPARKIGFKAVKALINRVHSGSPRKRSSPARPSNNAGPRSSTDQALLLASNPNVEEIVSGIPVVLKDKNRHPVNRTALSYRDHDLRLEPPDLTRTKSSYDPSPKSASLFHEDDGPPDLTETMSSADMSAELHPPEILNSDKLLEPPEHQKVEPPRPGSPELRKEDVSPVLAKNSRRRGLEPEAVVTFGERTPVDAPENTIPPGRLSIVGIPVDSDEVLSRMKANKPEMDADDDAITAVDENQVVADDRSITFSIASHSQNPFDSSIDGSIPMSARVARARRASKPINPFESSADDSSRENNSPKSGVEVKTNPFESSSDSGEIDDPFDRILLDNELDSLSDDGIPPPGDYVSVDPNESRNKQVRNAGPSPLRELNHGNQPPHPQRKVVQKSVTPQSESSLTPDQNQQKSEPTTRFQLAKQDADSVMETNVNAQDTIATKKPSPVFSKPREAVALADSLSEWSGNQSEDSAKINGEVGLRPQQVIGQIVADDDELNFPGSDSRLCEEKSFPDTTPKVSNEARNAALPYRKMLFLERAQQLGTNRKHKPAGGVDVGHDPSGSISNIKSVQAAHSPLSSTKDQYDRYHFMDTADEREDVVDQFFTFIRQTMRLTPKAKRSLDRSIEKLKPEAKLIVEAAVEKAKHAEITEGGLDQFYQDVDIELAFQNMSESSVQSIKQLMLNHKRMPVLKIKQLGESIASTGPEVDASDASELLSELQDFSSVVKGAAKRSLKKSQSAGRQAPKWTKELIDLTGVESFRDLDDEEAIWLFDQNSSPRTSRSDLESLMDFAAKRLGLALDPDIVLKAASKTKLPISNVTVGALSPQTNVSDSPFAAIRNDNSQSPKFKFDNDMKEKASTNKVVVEDVCYDSCTYAEVVLCGETGYGANNYQTVLKTSASNESSQGADKYNVSNQSDKYSKALDDKLFEDKLSEDQFSAADLAVPNSAKQTDQQSDVSSSDGLSVILAKIKRDIQHTEEVRNSERRHEVKEALDSDNDSQSMPPDTTKPPSRRDFLDILFEATGSLLCGAVDVGSHSVYGGARKKSKRKKEKRKPTEFIDDPDDPFSGLELESPSADDSPSEEKLKWSGSAFVNSLSSVNAHPPMGNPSYQLFDIATETRDRPEHFVDNQTEARPDEENVTIHQLDVDPFESTGSLLNKGPFSPIDEQPSAEEDFDYLSFRPEISPSPYKEVVGNYHGSIDSPKQVVVDEEARLSSAASDEPDLDVGNVDNASDRSCENVSDEDLEAAKCLVDDASNETDHDHAASTEVNKADRPHGGLSPNIVTETEQLVNNHNNDLPWQSNGPRPEDFQLHGRNVNLKQAARERPIPEVLERRFLRERLSSIHNCAESPDDINNLFGMSMDDSIEQHSFNASFDGDADVSANKQIHPDTNVKFPIAHGAPDTVELKVAVDKDPNQTKVPPTPEGLHGGYHSSCGETSFENPKNTSASSQTSLPPKPEGISGLRPIYAEKPYVFYRNDEINPPPAPELKRPSLPEISTSKVSMIRSKFENPSATWENCDKMKPKHQDVRSPESIPTRFSRISTLRSNFEKRLSGTKDTDGATLRNLTEEPSLELKLACSDPSIDCEEKEDFPDLIDLTSAGAHTAAADDGMNLVGNQRLDAMISEKPATLRNLTEEPSLELKLACSDPSIDCEEKEDFPDLIDLTSAGAHTAAADDGKNLVGNQRLDAMISEMPIESVLSRESLEAVLSGEGTRPESPIIVDEGFHIWGNDNPISQPEHIDLVSVKENRNSLGTWVGEDGRNSDIAFSLSPSTTASSRVLQPYTQHHLFDALPVLGTSSSSGGPDVQHAKPFERSGSANPVEVLNMHEYVKQLHHLSVFDDGHSGSQSSDGVSISSTNVEGAKHCDLDPNTVPDEIAVNIRSTPRSLIEKQQLSITLPWDDDDSDESSGDESASLLLALTRSEVESEVLDTSETTPISSPYNENNGTVTSKQTKEHVQQGLGAEDIIRLDDVSRDAIIRMGTSASTGRETEEKTQTSYNEKQNAPADQVPAGDVSNEDSACVRLQTSSTINEKTIEKAHTTSSEGRPDHVRVDDESRGNALLRIRTPSTVEQDSPRKVSSPLFSSIKKRLSKNKGESGSMPQPIDAEEIFATLGIHSVIDVTSYISLPDNDRTDRDLSASETSEGIASSETSARPSKLKTNHFLETIMDRLRVSPSAQRFTPKSNNNKRSPTNTLKGRSSESGSGDGSNKKESSDVDELFQRYDEIVKNMVVLDEERLARVQAKQMASIVLAADSAVDHVPHSPQALSEIARRLRRTAAERMKEDKVLAYRNEAAIPPGEDATTVAHGSISATSDSTHPSSHARQLRRDLQTALEKSSAIRSSQVKLGEDMANLQLRLQERRSLSPSRTQSLPSSPIKSYYHRNCAVSTDSTSVAGDLSPLNKEKEIPRTIMTKTTDMTSEDEDIQNGHLESIRSGLRSSVGQSPRGKARRRRFRRSE